MIAFIKDTPPPRPSPARGEGESGFDGLSEKARGWLIAAKYAVAVCILGAVLWQAGVAEVGDKLKGIEWPWLLLSFVFLNLSQIISGVRMRFYFSTRGLRLPYRFSLALYYVGMFFNTVLPGGVGGDGYKVYYLKKYSAFPAMAAVRIMLAERANGLLALLLILFALLPFTPVYGLFPLPGLSLSLGVGATLAGYFVIGRKVTGETVWDSLRALVLSFGIQLTILGSAIALFFGMGMGGQWMEYAALFLLAAVASILPISVGGVGIRELIFYAAEPHMLTSGTAGIAFSMVWFGVYLLSSLIGLGVMPGLKKMQVSVL